MISEDLTLPQVIFQVGQMTSISCGNISINSDIELEEDQFFTISIVSAGAEPHARVRSPSVATVTIIKGRSTSGTSTASSDDESGVLSLEWAIAIPALCSVMVGLTSCILAVVACRYLSKCPSCVTRKNLAGDDPLYDDIVNNGRPTFQREGGTVIQNESEALEANQSYIYVQSNISLSTHPPPANDMDIDATENESYVVADLEYNRGRYQEVTTMFMNEAYSGFQTTSTDNMDGNISTTDTTTETSDRYVEVIS